MAVQVLRIVSVASGNEVSRAELAVDGTVAYSGPDDGDTARSVIRNRMRDQGLTTEGAFRAVKRAGWSNGYLMVPLDEIG